MPGRARSGVMTEIPQSSKQLGARRPVWAYLSLAAVAMLLGVVLRLAPLGVPFVLTKWGGSALWAAMVYLLFAALLPTRGVWTVASVAGVFATLLELTRLYHSPGLD